VSLFDGARGRARRNWPARAIGPVVFSLLLLCSARPARAADDHAEAQAAAADLRAAIAAITQADMTYSTDRAVYHDAGRHAANLLIGTRDPAYSPALAKPGDDPEGAIGRIDHLLDRTATPAWANALRGAEANLRAAAATLLAAGRAHELMDFQTLATSALASLELAQGRASETGVLGGIEGALANTTLAIPGGAAVADACAAPQTAPAYGVHDGALAWIALPASQGAHALAAPFGGRTVAVEGDFLVLHTAAAASVEAACARQHAAAAPAAAAPTLYTREQALAGEGVFMAQCASCHGMNLHGVSAPAVAGSDFLATAKTNGWTLEVVRTLVFTMMPFNAAGTLPPKQYAEVMAFLLAANCYPAGKTAFPTADQPGFAKIQLAPQPGRHPGEDANGTCAVQ
jgi:mono/diheme cytochrome c family protein